MVYSFGTDEYIESVVEKYSKTLLRIAFNILHSTAESEDAVQDVMLSLITHAPKFESEEHEKAWLIRATINRAHNYVRARKRFQSGEELPDEPQYEDHERGELLSAVLSLPEKYSVPVHLYYYEGYTTAQTAKILKLPVATVCTRLSRARARLRDMLDEQGGRK